MLCHQEISRLQQSNQVLDREKGEVLAERDKNIRLVNVTKTKLKEQTSEIERLQKDVENLEERNSQSSEECLMYTVAEMYLNTLKISFTTFSIFLSAIDCVFFVCFIAEEIISYL